MASVMLDPDRLDELTGQISPEDFFYPWTRLAFAAVVALHDGCKPIDPITVGEKLERDGNLDRVGGYDKLREIIEKVPHASHAAHYATIVRGRAMSRLVASACSEGLLECEKGILEPQDIAAQVESGLHGVIERRSLMRSVSISEVLLEALDRVGKETAFGVTSGFTDLDKLTNGWQPGSMVVLAARPSVGKTALATKFMLNAAKRETPVLFVSLEQTMIEIADRVLSMESCVPLDDMRRPGPSEQLCDTMSMTAGVVSGWPLVIDDTPGRTIQTIAGVSRLMRRRKNVGLIVVDYLQLIEPADRRTPREQQVSEISRGLKRIARDLQVPLICLAQLNRAIEQRADRKPQLSDLRESGSIEQDADIVMFIDRPAIYDPANAEQGEAKLWLAKNRNGKTGCVDLNWHGPTMTFRPGVPAEFGGL